MKLGFNRPNGLEIFENGSIRRRWTPAGWVYYTMHNILSNFLCFASLFAHHSSILNNFNCNDENWILGK